MMNKNSYIRRLVCSISLDIAGGGDRITRDLFWRKERGTTEWKAIRRGSLKCVAKTSPGNSEEFPFDLRTDAIEQINLRKTRPKDFDELKTPFESWEEETRKFRRDRPGWVSTNQ